MKRLIILTEIIIIILLLMASGPEAEIGAEKQEQKYFTMLATAYTPGVESCGIWADGYTYTGDKAGYGCVAIDPKAGILKLGQRVYVEGYGYGICNDIGGAIKGWRVDLCFETVEEALNFGRRLVNVYILEGGK